MEVGSSVKILQKTYEMFNGNYEIKSLLQTRNSISKPATYLNVKIFETSEIEMFSSLNAGISVAINAFKRTHS